MLREWRLLDAINDADVRVPKMLAACSDTDVIGAPFYVMEYMIGDVITTEIPEPLDNPEQRARIGNELVDALVEVHAVDWRARGLEGYGKPTGYLERQLRRFTGLWEVNKTRELPVLEQVTQVADRQHAGVGTGDDRARRLPARQRDAGQRGTGATQRDLRLGAFDDRRPARRPRLHDDALAAGRRSRERADQRSGQPRAARASRLASS